MMFENKLRLEGNIQGSISKKLLSHVADFGHSRSRGGGRGGVIGAMGGGFIMD